METYTYNYKGRKVIILKNTYVYPNLPVIEVLNLDMETASCIAQQIKAESMKLTDWNFGDLENAQNL